MNNCIFKIDTNSVSIINVNLVESDKLKIKIDDCNLRYPMGEKVFIEY